MSPKVKYDVKGVEPGQDFSEPIPTGLYTVRVQECTLTVSGAGNDQVAVVYEVVDGKHKGRLLWDYVVLSVGWKMRQFLEGVGHIKDGKGEKGDFEPEQFIGTLLQARVKHDHDDEYGTRAKIANVIPMPEDGEVEAEVEADEEELTWDDLAEMELDDLKDVIEDEDLDIRITKRSNVGRVRERVAEALDIEPEAEEPEEPEEPEDEEEEDDYDEWSVAELRSELKERGLKSGGKQSLLIKRLRKDDAEDDDNPF